MMNTLTTPLIRLIRPNGTAQTVTLPGALAALVRNDVSAFTALRPHQRHPWHAFLVQLATLALLRAGRRDLPDDVAQWVQLLRGLTPEHPNDAPWCLAGPADQPALLQPALPGGQILALRKIVPTPDSLDMLVTSRNHDIKNGAMTRAEPDDWLFALATLQTMEGFLGAGNYGISRMNGGFASRPAVGLAPRGGPGLHMARDIRVLLAMGGRPPLANGYAESDGLALVWLRPWDGKLSMSRTELDPLYIEICRRVRLQETASGFVARTDTSETGRIAGVPGGVTGDPWTPVRPDKEGYKALTVDKQGFGYRPLVKIMFPSAGSVAPLQNVADDDPEQDLILVARALVRGQGKTEGYHERRVPWSRTVKRRTTIEATDPVAQAAQDRVALAGAMFSVLRFALIALFENGPAQVDAGNDAAELKAGPFLARFEREVDLAFFEALWREVDVDTDDGEAERAEWVRGLFRLAQSLLTEADGSAAKASRRRFRAREGAEAALHGGARRNQRLSGYLVEESSRNAG